MPNPFRYFNSSPEVIRAAVLLYVKYPLSLRNVEDLLAERGIDVCHATVLHAKNATAVGSTIGLRIRTSRFGDANVPCIGSGEWVRCRNSRPCTRLFTTISITSAISSTAPRTRPVAPPPWRSGGSLQADVDKCWLPARRCRYIDRAGARSTAAPDHRGFPPGISPCSRHWQLNDRAGDFCATNATSRSKAPNRFHCRLSRRLRAGASGFGKSSSFLPR